MELRQKDIMWIGVVIAFYILSAILGLYNISAMILFPLLAVPMTLLLIKTKQRELVIFIGIMLAVVISFLTTNSLNLIIMSIFLIFILAPGLVVGSLYEKKTSVPRIIIVTTIVVFLGGIIFLTVSKILGVDYLEIYFLKLDEMKTLMNDALVYGKVQSFLPPGDQATETYLEAMGRA